jgi:hypothetical protein
MAKNQLHEFAPVDYRDTPYLTGDYEFDASIAACKNKDMPKRLKMYLAGGPTGSHPVTNYDGYHNYNGDD